MYDSRAFCLNKHVSRLILKSIPKQIIIIGIIRQVSLIRNCKQQQKKSALSDMRTAKAQLRLRIPIFVARLRHQALMRIIVGYCRKHRRKKKILTRLRICTCWSGLLLFTFDVDSFLTLGVT